MARSSIQDPEPAFRPHQADRLSDWLQRGGQCLEGDLRGIARFALRSPASTRFLVAALSQPAALIQSLPTDISLLRPEPAACPSNSSIRWMRPGRPPPDPCFRVLTVCDGAQSLYQIVKSAPLSPSRPNLPT